jgi:hypothetical protein
MQPNYEEIKDVGDAFISLGYETLSPQESEYLNHFLKQYAKDYDDAKINALFKNKAIIQAFKTLNDFAKKYQADDSIIQEFNEEIYDLLINLNRKNEGIMI